MIDRRRLLEAGVAAAASVALWPLRALARHDDLARQESLAALPKSTQDALRTSGLVYVCPLRSDGEESRCHGEVWFGWIDGAVLVNTGSDRWKARSVRQGLDRARIWVGDFGRWKRTLGTNEDFRNGPSFDARADFVTDVRVLERLLALYGKKYPKEIGKWRDSMRQGFADGSRVLVRYRPV